MSGFGREGWLRASYSLNGRKNEIFENFFARLLWKNDELKLPFDRAGQEEHF